MGNRGGRIHNEQREIVRRYASRRWIVCVLEFRGRHRTVMAPRRYTELFFLDEAVALSAGHRPCFECRRERFYAFQNAWNASRPPGADEMDDALHASRLGPGFEVPAAGLPNGCFVELEGAPWLVWHDALALWTPQGYERRIGRPGAGTVRVLTPGPTVACLERGYVPQIHPSLGL